MKKCSIPLIFVMVFVLTFCGTAAAHPGHGIYPQPEEVTSDQTSDQSTGGTTSTGSTTGTSSKKSTSTKSTGSTNTGTKSVQTGTTSSKSTDNAGDQSVEDTSKSDKTTNTTSDANTSDTNATSRGSNNSPWNTAAIGGFLAVGLGSVGLFFKGFLFGR